MLTLAPPWRWRALPRLPMCPDTLLALLCVYWALVANRRFLGVARAALEAGPLQLFALVALIALLHFVLLWPFTPRPLAKPVLALLALVAAVSSHFVQSLGTVMDPTMLRNALQTDWPEARELLGASMLLHVGVQLLPAWLLIAQVELPPYRPRAWRWAFGRLLIALGLLIGLMAVMAQPLSSLMRNHKTLRYQLLPAAPLWSLPRSLVAKTEDAVQVREPIGVDARPGASWARAERPRLLVLVVGETARAANWGRRQLPDGSWRDTTPELRELSELLQWERVQTCGTDTETSVPCLFAPVGRRDYDESRIRRQESLLHVLNRAGVQLHWVDNQSGCKGVCDHLPTTQLQCAEGRCLDDALVAALPEALQEARQKGGMHLLVLHMLGNHGPAYHRRVPEGFAPYSPACASDDLGRCERAAIVNAYDNAIRHSDALLARLWRGLREAQGSVDTALIYVSDHGESLGEKGLYLHGMPYAIAPREQTEVPMLMGIAPAWALARGWRAECLNRLPQRPASHEHLFHTVLDLLDVRTGLYARDWDLLAGCAPS